MQNIITITKSEIGTENVNSVNARDIHEFLEVKTRFDMWIQRAIEKYDFKANIDFCTILGESSGGRKATDYIVTLDMAKELSMLENNSKGREIRKYFIKIEKKHITSLELNSNSKELEFYKNKYFEALERENKILRDVFYNNSILTMKPEKSGTKFSNLEIQKVKELKEQGYSTRQIAKILNRSHNGVHRHFRKGESK